MPDYYTILAQKISEAEDDPAKLRELVYAAARLALKRHVNLYPAASLQQGKQLLRDLETAISRLEEDAERTSARAEQDPVQDDTQTFFETRASTTEAPPPAPEFDFRAAFEGTNSDPSEEDGDRDDGSAEHSADDVPAAASEPQPEKEISFTHRSTRQERSTDAPRREERRAHANRRGVEPDQASSRRPDRRFAAATTSHGRSREYATRLGEGSTAAKWTKKTTRSRLTSHDGLRAYTTRLGEGSTATKRTKTTTRSQPRWSIDIGCGRGRLTNSTMMSRAPANSFFSQPRVAAQIAVRSM